MKNFKFFAKCILALLPFILFSLYAGIFKMAYMDSEYPAWKYTKDLQTGKLDYGNDFGTLILGDSRAMADLKPELISQDTVNLAFGGATSIEMYYTLDNYLSCHEAPENVFILFAPFHYSYMDNYWTRDMYFHHLSVSDSITVLSEGKKAESETILSKNITSLISYSLYLPDTYLPALINAKLFSRYQENTLAYKEFIKNRGHGLYGTKDGSSDLNYEASYEAMRKTGDHVLIDIYMNKLLTLCENNGINVVIEQVPMNEASYNSLNETFVRDYTSYLEDFKEKYKGITVNTQIPCFDNSLFGDSSHLNDSGANTYSEQFRIKYSNYLSK